MRKTLAVVFFILLTGLVTPVSAGEPGVWKIRAAYNYQILSFASNAHGTNVLASYDRRRQWGVRAGFHYVDKFGDSAPGYDLGGTWWATPKTSLSLDMQWAPKQIVIPRQSYRLGVDQLLFKGFVGSLSYRFADYASARAHTVSPGFDWYFWPRWDWVVKYYVSVSNTGGQTGTTNSVMTRVNWSLMDTLIFHGGFSHGQERFESGNIITPAGRFTANHGFGGVRWTFYKGLGVDASFDYENRSNGTTVKTFETGLSCRF